MGVRIVTDSSCDLPPQLDEELRGYGVKMVPIFFRFGSEEFADKSMPMQEFFGRAAQVWPQTAVPAPGAFVEAFREPVEAGHEVVCLTITGKHSAIYDAAAVASRQFPAGAVTVIDSSTLSIGLGVLVIAAARAAAQGKSVAEIVATVTELQRRLHLFITLDTVDYLVKGGRASRIGGLVAGLLRIRPILTLRDGELTLLGKPRGREAAKRELIELARAESPADVLGVGHVACEGEARQLIAELARQMEFPAEKIFLIETGMVLATHAGPGTLGIVAVRKSGN